MCMAVPTAETEVEPPLLLTPPPPEPTKPPEPQDDLLDALSGLSRHVQRIQELFNPYRRWTDSGGERTAGLLGGWPNVTVRFGRFLEGINQGWGSDELFRIIGEVRDLCARALAELVEDIYLRSPDRISSKINQRMKSAGLDSVMCLKVQGITNEHQARARNEEESSSRPNRSNEEQPSIVEAEAPVETEGQEVPTTS